MSERYAHVTPASVERQSFQALPACSAAYSVGAPASEPASTARSPDTGAVPVVVNVTPRSVDRLSAFPAIRYSGLPALSRSIQMSGRVASGSSWTSEKLWPPSSERRS